MTKPLAPHPQHCWGCSNKDCEFYEQRGYLSISSEERDTGIRVSEMTPAEFTNRKGCASHSSTTTPLNENTSTPTQNEFIAEFVGMEEKKRREHDAQVAKAERERVLDSVVIRCHFLTPPDILDEPHHRIERATLEKVFKEIKSLRGGELG